eukprot:CAMPEP_0115384812 /NCGR_PEP_ID=MMETSP0271-20121206/7302_1 /TAXON_ID=71861 /ORGANISM="Scrippsiella trochoidea, Strain CCMP3099" /LENGTH=222 /DNA_ID=CAMNT_0002808181 /DNA_START=409 /DNA_END=1077 /DNA_ORIENTATION=-
MESRVLRILLDTRGPIPEFHLHFIFVGAVNPAQQCCALFACLHDGSHAPMGMDVLHGWVPVQRLVMQCVCVGNKALQVISLWLSSHTRSPNLLVEVIHLKAVIRFARTHIHQIQRLGGSHDPSVDDELQDPAGNKGQEQKPPILPATDKCQRDDGVVEVLVCHPYKRHEVPIDMEDPAIHVEHRDAPPAGNVVGKYLPTNWRCNHGEYQCRQMQFPWQACYA